MKKRLLCFVLSTLMVMPSASLSFAQDDGNAEKSKQGSVYRQVEEDEGRTVVHELQGSDELEEQTLGKESEKEEEFSDETASYHTIQEYDHSPEREAWLEYLKENGLYEEVTPEDLLSYEEEQILYFEGGEKDSASEGAFLRSAKTPLKEKTRYTVLLLDASGSMSGKPFNMMKAAAIKFCEAVYSKSNSIENYVAVVPYGDIIAGNIAFSKNLEELKNAINGIDLIGGTDIHNALTKADVLLSDSEIPSNAIKNIILLSDGLPFHGKTSKIGPYTREQHSSWELSNACYNKAEELKAKGYFIYTLGFFHSIMVSNELNFAKRFMQDLQNAGYYNVIDASTLEFVFGEIASSLLELSGTFRYPGSVKERDYGATYVYKDIYFKNSSYVYNPSLATMSFCLELSACASADELDYANKSRNAKKLLDELGFVDFECNDFYKVKPTTDSIGAVAANKKVLFNGKEYTLIALAVRGGGYEKEWASNFTIGSVGYHQGFHEARENVIAFLEEYIRAYRIAGDIKLWIVGFSRGGATANLVAGRINEGGVDLSGCKLLPRDMYAYTFEAPQGAIKNQVQDPIHYNIHNIINIDDPVPYVAPTHWDFGRYGKTKYLPHPRDDQQGQYETKLLRMKKQWQTLESVEGATYNEDSFQIIGSANDGKNGREALSQGEFLSTFVNTIAKNIGTRSIYVKAYQKGMREIFRVLNDMSKGQREAFGSQMKLKLNEQLVQLLSVSPEKRVAQMKQILKESFDKAGYKDYNEQILTEVAEVLLQLVIETGKKDLGMALTALANRENFGKEHHPEVCLAWLQSMDTNYEKKAMVGLSTGKRRLIRINCPVDVDIYDNEDDALVARFVDGKPVEMDTIMVHGINWDGEMCAYLPPNGSYTVKIKSTGEGLLNYNITEDAVNDAPLRVINYLDIAIVPGMEFTVLHPKYSEEDLEEQWGDGSSLQYIFMNEATKQEIKPTYELRGERAEQTVQIDIESEDESKGFASGSDSRVPGSFAQATAYPHPGYRFDGWYENGKKVSDEIEYRFRADSDRRLIGKFVRSESSSQSNASGVGINNSGNQSNHSETAKQSSNTNQNKSPNSMSKTLTDIESHWAEKVIRYALDTNMVSGYPDATFKPNQAITRAEFISMLLKVNGWGTTSYHGKFVDVRADDWHAQVVQTALDKGIISGYSDGTFRPNQAITRAEMISIIISSIGRTKATEQEAERILSVYKDYDRIPSWARLSIADAVQQDLVCGYDGRLYADKGASRAEAVSILYRLKNK